MRKADPRMKLDLSRLLAISSEPGSVTDLEMAEEIASSIKGCEHNTGDGCQVHLLPPSSTILPPLRKPKEKSTWEKFAELKNIRRSKKVFCKRRKRYMSAGNVDGDSV